MIKLVYFSYSLIIGSCNLCKLSNLTKDQWDEHKESDKHKLNIDVSCFLIFKSLKGYILDI